MFNEEVVFRFVYLETSKDIGEVLSSDQETLESASQCYEEFTESFYRNTKWEFDTPPKDLLLLEMRKFIIWWLVSTREV